MISYEKIFENNANWIAKKKATDAAFFEKLAQDQNPDYLYIGCSDSRVTAEEMMGAAPGEIFVHRNIGNLVVSIDVNVMSVINYAVKILQVKHIIVCGHYNCGGVKISASSIPGLEISGMCFVYIKMNFMPSQIPNNNLTAW